MKRVLEHAGAAGIAGLVLLAGALLFFALVVTPMAERNAALQAQPVRKQHELQSSAKVAAVYAHLRSADDATDWLARLHAVGMASGVQLKSAAYRAQKTEGRIVRTEIVLPVAGSYAQIRDFMQRALSDIPVLSLDQVTLRREEGRNATLHAEMRVTLHMVGS